VYNFVDGVPQPIIVDGQADGNSVDVKTIAKNLTNNNYSAIDSKTYNFYANTIAPQPIATPFTSFWVNPIDVEFNIEGGNTNNTEIYYTINGGTPTIGDTLYTSSIPLSYDPNNINEAGYTTYVIRAINFDSTYDVESILTTKIYYIGPELIAPDPLIFPVKTNQEDSFELYLQSSLNNSNIYYTFGIGTSIIPDPTDSDNKYEQPIEFNIEDYDSNSVTITIKAITYKDGYTPSNVVSITYTLTKQDSEDGGPDNEIDPIDGEDGFTIPLSTPNILKPSGTYYVPQDQAEFLITIVDSTADNGVVRYTTNGEDVGTESAEYTGVALDAYSILSDYIANNSNSINNATLTIKAKAFAAIVPPNSESNYTDSDQSEATYTFTVVNTTDIFYRAKNAGVRNIKVKPRRTYHPDHLISNQFDNTIYLQGGTDNIGHTDTIGGGDIFICLHSMRISGRLIKSSNDNIYKAIVRYVAESRDNIELRHQGTEYNEIYHPKSSIHSVLHIEQNEANLESGNQIDFFDNYYGYNIDYRAAQDIKTAIPYEKNQRFEATKFPTRVIRSQKSDPGSSSDFFRTFLENDFKDFGYNRGDLVKINKYANNLLLHMERAIMITRGREELSTGDFRAFLGAGNIFAVEPNELLMSEDGTGGLQNQHHSLLTEEGYFFVDQEEGSIYSLTSNGLANISDIGMRNEFEKILPWDLKTYSNDFNPYVLDKRYFTITLGYDKEHSRIFFSKKELTPTQYFIDLYNAGSIEFSENSFVHKNATVYNSDGIASTQNINIPYTANQYFKNKDVTLSYVPQLNAWVSYHSYTPQYYFNSISKLYSSGPFNPITNRYQTLFQYNSKDKAILSTESVEFSGGEEKSPTHSAYVQDTLYLNTEDNVFTSMSAVGLNTIFGNYNDIPDKPFQIGFVENRSPAETKTFYSLSLITSVKDKDGVEDKDKTFTNFQLFTALQDSGSQEIIPFQSLANQGNARNVNGTWMINKFRTSNDEWWKRSRFMDKYVEVLLTYYNYDNNFLYLTNSEVGVKKTVR